MILALFLPNLTGIAQKSNKKFFIPGTVSTFPVLEHSQKKLKYIYKNKSKKFKILFYPNFKLNGLGQEENEIKWNFVPGTISPDPNYSIPKKIVNKFKRLKNIILALFMAIKDQDGPKKG